MAWNMHDSAGDVFNLLHSSGAATMFRVKETLKHAGWTVLSSSDGTTYNAAGDQISAEGAGANGMNNNSAWFRITDPGSLREYIFQRGANHYTWTLQYSRLDKFVGGAPNATTIPTATDMKGLRGAGLSTGGQIFPTATTWYAHIAAQTAATGNVYPFWVVAKEAGAGTGRMTLICEALDVTLAPAADDDLSLYYQHWCTSSQYPKHDDAYSAEAINSDYAGDCFWGWVRYNEVNEEYNRYLALTLFYFNDGATVTRCYPGAVAPPNAESNRYPLLPPYWTRVRAATVMGYKGVSKHLRWNPRTDVMVYGDVVSDDLTANIYLVWGCLLLQGWTSAGVMPSA